MPSHRGDIIPANLFNDIQIKPKDGLILATRVAEFVLQAVAKEREECANVAEDFEFKMDYDAYDIGGPLPADLFGNDRDQEEYEGPDEEEHNAEHERAGYDVEERQVFPGLHPGIITAPVIASELPDGIKNGGDEYEHNC